MDRWRGWSYRGTEAVQGSESHRHRCQQGCRCDSNRLQNFFFHSEIRSKAIDRERRRYKYIRDFRREKKA